MGSTSSVASFGEWLREKRKALKLTQEELAERVACSAITIRKIEAGERLPSEQVAQLLAQVLNVAPDRHDHFIMFARGEIDAEAAEEALRYSRTASNFNLPAPLTQLIGREQEMESLRELLFKGRQRLVTLAGPPGIGKTRLGIEVAWAVASSFADGVVFVPLATIHDPDLVLSAVAGALEMRDSGNQPLLIGLIRHLQGRRVLLVLDNFEQVLDAAPHVARLMEGCPDLKVLVTSREPLHIRGEQRFFVPTLPLPDPTHLSDLQTLAVNPAIELFVQRARGNGLTFSLSDANARSVAAICTQLDGLPLAIELAAARTGILSPAEIEERLGSRLGLLTTGSKDLPPHQRTLRATIEWSYNLMDDGERKLFARLGVFVGGCTLSAVGAVCNAQGDLPMDLLDGLASLKNKSLLKQDETIDASRFSMLETIREYAKERLRESEEAETIRRLHVEYYLALAEAAEPELRGPEQVIWLQRLEREYGNFRDVLSWSRRSENEDATQYGLRLTGSLLRFWIMSNYLSEGREWAAALLSKPQASGRTLARARALLTAGMLAMAHGDRDSALDPFKEGLTIAQDLGDDRIMASARLGLGEVFMEHGDCAESRRLFEESLATSQEIEDKAGMADVLHYLGHLMSIVEDYKSARSFNEQGLAIRKEIGDEWGMSYSYQCLGHIAYDMSDYEAARWFTEQSLRLRRQYPEEAALAFCLAQIAQVDCAQGLLERGVRLFGAADRYYEQVGARMYKSVQLRHDRSVAIAREQLGGDAFETLYAEGLAMTLQQAIDYAMETRTRHGLKYEI